MKLITILLYGFIVFGLRAWDSMLTVSLLHNEEVEFVELNPFVDTVSFWSVYFSWLPFFITISVFIVFVIVVSNRDYFLADFRYEKGGVKLKALKHLLNVPLAVVFFYFLAVANNMYIWIFGESPLPELVTEIILVNPLFSIALIGIFFGVFLDKPFNGIMYSILRVSK